MANNYLVKQVAVENKRRTKDMGTNRPDWVGDYSVSSWYNSPLDDGYDYNFFYNIVGETTYVQYGKNKQGWASARFFSQTIKVLSQEMNEDRSVTANVRVTPHFFRGRKTTTAVAGFDVNYRATINGQSVYQFSGNTYQDFNQGEKPPLEFTVTVPPETTTRQTALVININYPNGEFDNQELVLGFGLYNPTPPVPPNYKPMSIRKSGAFKTINRDSGFIEIRKTNQWTDVSEELLETILEVNQGQNRIRQNNQWRQLPPMEDE